jgi:hypothetical protein
MPPKTTYELVESNGTVTLVAETVIGEDYDLEEILEDAPACVKARLLREYRGVVAEIGDAVRADEPGVEMTAAMRSGT